MKIFTTGGTIDKIYFDANSEFQVGEPAIQRLLQEEHVGFEYEVVSLMRKDSLEITDEDRALIRRHVAEARDPLVLVTHGTDTMTETAQALGGIEDKTIVLTGAMQPARITASDAVFNVGGAVMAVQLLPPGVYIVMQGRVLDPGKVRKNLEKQRFERLPDADSA